MNQALPAVREQFHTPGQQLAADRLGMWLFLASEAMLFGAIFLALTVYHLLHPDAMQAATRRLDLTMGGINTAILLTSSTTMALAVKLASQGRRWPTLVALLATVLLGLAFEAIKVHSWFDEARQGLLPGYGPPFPLPQPAAQLYFHLYLVSTGIHALHLAVGIVLVGGVALGLMSRLLKVPERAVNVELVGLYWQFVDIVWIFLFPTLYLVSR